LTRLWPQDRADWHLNGYANGAYDIQIRRGGWWAWCGPAGSYQDFVCELKGVFRGQHPNSSLGIFLGLSENGSIKILGSEEGQVKLVGDDEHKDLPGRKNLPSRMVADAAKPAGAINTLTVRVRGTSCEVFLNGIRVIDRVEIQPTATPASPGITVEGGVEGGD